MIATFASSELERFRRLIARHLGLQFDDARVGFLADVLRRRLEATKQVSDVYFARLDAEGSPDELTMLAQELTVAETYFFRHVEQYRAFAEVALPDRLRCAHASGARLQIVSAGCASGEEPYSLALVIRDAGIDYSENVSILGVDINTALLEKATRGRFSPWVLRDTTPDVQRRWFRSEGREFVLDDTVRASVRFAACNLAGDCSEIWQPESHDIVFYRNVLMYFTVAGAQAVVGRLTRALRPGGYLFLGHAETLRGLSNDFHLRHTHGTFYYQRKDRVELGLDQVVPARPIARGRPMALPESLLDGTSTWVETIHRASQRIEALTTLQEQSLPGRAPVAPPPTRVWEIGLVLELLREERFGEALELVETFPSEAGPDTEVMLLRVVLLAHSGQLTTAEHACERLLEIDELNAGAHYLLALCREGAGDRHGSLYHDQVAVYVDPGFAMAHLHLGLVASRTQDRATARQELEQAIALLQREDASRLLLFGGGFSRGALVALCRAELLASGGYP